MKVICTMPNDKDKTELRNRMCGAGEQPASWFLANEENWRIHPLHQTTVLTGVLKEIGFVSRVIVNKRTDASWGDRRCVETLVDGHDRVKIALSQGDDTAVPFEYVDLLPNEEGVVLATFDPIGALAVTDQKMLDDLIAQVSAENADVQQFLDELSSAEDTQLYGGGNELSDDDVIAKWNVSLGQVWTVPSICNPTKSHRVVCGDSRQGEVSDRLMCSDQAYLLIGDPPTNNGADTNDNITEEEYEQFTKQWMELWSSYSTRQLVTPGMQYFNKWMQWFSPFYVTPWLKVVSQQPGKTSKFASFDPILMFGDELDWMLYFGDGWKRRRTNDVFQHQIEHSNSTSRFHPTTKPLSLYVDIIESYTESGEIICDPFAGLLTSVVAAENTGRICYAMDISPRYIAFGLERIQRECGLQPRLEGVS